MRPQTRKVRAALEIWRRWPTEIEFDLLNLPSPVDIADWLQGTRDEHGRLKLSSRRLLLILEKLPDTSEFKTWALRKGDWTRDEEIAAKTHNEVAKLVSAYLQAHGVEGDDVLFYPFLSRSERAELAAESAEEQLASMELESLLSNAIDQ